MVITTIDKRYVANLNYNSLENVICVNWYMLYCIYIGEGYKDCTNHIKSNLPKLVLSLYTSQSIFTIV